MYARPKYSAFLYLLLLSPVACTAFVETRLPFTCKARSTSNTTPSQLFLFSWFSSKKPKDNAGDESKGVWGAEPSGSNKNKNRGSTTSSTNTKGLGGVAGIMDSMENFKTAQQVGKMTNSLVQELASTTVEGVAVEGKVKVIFDGQQQPVGVQIDDGYLKNVDSSDLSIALTSAMKDAYRKSAERMDDKMKSFYIDLGLK